MNRESPCTCGPRANNGAGLSSDAILRDTRIQLRMPVILHESLLHQAHLSQVDRLIEARLRALCYQFQVQHRL